MTDFTITDIQRLVVHPGEVLLVRVPATTSQVDHERVCAAFAEALPGVPVFVVIDSIEFSVVSQEATA